MEIALAISVAVAFVGWLTAIVAIRTASEESEAVQVAKKHCQVVGAARNRLEEVARQQAAILRQIRDLCPGKDEP